MMLYIFFDFIGKLKLVKYLQACKIFLIKYPDVFISLRPKFLNVRFKKSSNDPFSIFISPFMYASGKERSGLINNFQFSFLFKIFNVKVRHDVVFHKYIFDLCDQLILFHRSYIFLKII